jgi:long-subunit fatty acid transport protein
MMSPGVSPAQVLTTLEFSFSNPGARSMGFGGAFVALADDATAAFANPAGLVQLTRPEVSIEGRSWSYSTPYTSGGRAAGAPTGIGIDTEPGPVEARSSVDLTGLSYMSFVYPRKSWSVAVFRHQLINFELNQEIQGLFAPGAVHASSYRGPIERGSFDLKMMKWGVAVGKRVSDVLSLGLGFSRFNPIVTLTGLEYLPDEDTVESYFAESSFRADRLVDTRAARDIDSDWALAGGFLWKVSERWQIGGAYREGPELEMAVVSEAGPAHPTEPAGQHLGSGKTPWAFPDVYSVGAAYRSGNGLWTASFEWTRVEYSRILESLEPPFNDSDSFIEDADELHLGAEYVFLESTPVVALRAGLWHDPDHRTKTTSEFPTIRAEHIPGSDELHYAAGIGVAFPGFQIDFGVDLSEFRDAVSISAIYSF